MPPRRAFPLDHQSNAYPYLERPNAMLIALVRRHVLALRPAPRILDIGCGAGANARAIRAQCAAAHVVGIEPHAPAAALARQACAQVFTGTVEQWLAAQAEDCFDGLILSDVIEHTADPVRLLQALARHDSTRGATWVLSVPNYGVWYNRLRTLAGRFDYAWSGLYDRTHLRFFTRRSLRDLLEYCGLELIADRCSPSLAQSTAPLLRRRYARSLSSGQHLALADSALYRAYQQLVEPWETRLCQLWPELLGFQIVAVGRPL